VKTIVLMNGVGLNICRNATGIGLTLNVFETKARDSINLLDGIAAFGDRQYRHGDGTFSMESANFINSWGYGFFEITVAARKSK